MKRVGLLLAAGAVILGSAASAWAQAAAPPAFTVTFNGQARVVGGASDNTIDFVDTRADGKGGSAFKDSFHDFSNRFRLWTNVTSGDQHAGAVWALEVGDIIWGTGGGTSNNDGGGGNRVPQGLSSSSASARTGNGAGGAFGADGVNVETKHAYLWFDIPELPNARLTMGIQNVQFLTQPTEFVSEDAEAIKFDWKMDPIALQLWFARIGDAGGPGAPNNNAQDNDIYTARVWFKPIPDWTFSAEGMVWNQQCFSRQIATTTTPTTVASATPGVPVVSGVPAVSTARTGPCLKSDFGDTFFVGGTFSGKIAGIGLDGGVLYGQRELPGALGAAQPKYKESGWGFDVAATIPINPVTVTVEGWYTSGDKNRAPGDTSFANGAGAAVIDRNGKKPCDSASHAGYVGCFTGDGAGANGQNNSGLVRNSDRLPSPDDQGTWYTRPLIAEIFFGEQTIGGPPEGTSAQYAEKPGTYGVGGAAMLAITPSLSVGAGAAFVGATDRVGLFGKDIIEIDGGVFYTLNANLSIQGLAGYIFPDQGDNAWGAAVRTVFNF